MIPGDSEAAVPGAATLVPDPRVTHFYDPHHHAGRAVAASIGAPDQIAWDMYLFYDPTASEPTAWFHQLRGRDWAGPDRYRWGEDLALALSETAASRWPSRTQPTPQ